jgi:hypothetical protein
VQCVTLTVPEDRAQPTGRKVTLPVVKAPATRARTVPSIAFAGLTGPVTDTTDRSISDQWSIGVRGEPGTRPVLACPEADRGRRERLAMDSSTARMVHARALDRCMTRLAGEGLDLSAYGPDDVADDARDLVLAAGLDRVDVRAYGAAALPSYALVRRSPALVRALRLSSPAIEPSDSVQRASDAERAFSALALRCAADPVCNSSVPDLEARTDALRTTVAAAPRLIETTGPDGAPAAVLIDPGRVQAALWLGLHDDTAYGLIPTVIGQQSFDLVASYVALRYIDDPLIEQTVRSLVWECRRGAGRDAAGVTLVQRQYPQWSALASPETVEQCRKHRIGADATALAPLVSDKPALVAYGEFEPEAARIARLPELLSAAELLRLRGRVWADRSAWPSCVTDVRQRFMLDPSRSAGAARCGRTAEPVPFTTAAPPSFG